MKEKDLQVTLNNLISLPGETEVVEFKEAKNDFAFDKIGKYFSALSNEANLKRKPYAWLIFGIEDKHHKVVGSRYRENRKYLDSLKEEIANKINNRLTFIEIHELKLPEGRILMFQIPAAPQGLPVNFEGHYYGRNGESLSPLNIVKLEKIRKQTAIVDWSSEVVPGASIDDLDLEAIQTAKINFKTKFPDKAQETDSWDTITFLNKAKLTVKGNMTRTTILLLGKDESEHLLQPANPKIRWLLKDSHGNDKDYAIFGLPLLLAVDKIYSKIRNLKYRYIKDGTLFPDEIEQYEPYTIREAVNNSIAHQDYTKGGMINVIEMDDQLVFTNLGNFIPGDVERVVKDDAPEEYYRNRFLATAMFNLKMVDTAGGGIRKMFNFQRHRFFPMPDYDLTEEKVKLTIIGKVLDIEYARLLARDTDLILEDIILLDKVQKHKILTAAEEKHLRLKGLIEGRKPNYFISLKVAQKTGQKAAYSKNKAFDKDYYLNLIMKAIEQHGFMRRKDVDDLLWSKLPEWMDDKQKKIKIANLLAELRKNGKIKNKGSDTKPEWMF
jgi:ATP-dependent DNA helicase RecG